MAATSLAPMIAPEANAAPRAPLIAPFSAAADNTPPAPWRVITLPKLPRHTRYTVMPIDGGRALKMESDGGYANLLHPLTSDVGATPWLRWRWRVEAQPAGADLRHKASDDTPARVCVLFDLPLDRLRTFDRIKVQLGRTLFDPELPAAALCYVWDARLPAGTWLANAYTSRVQMLVLRSTASGHADGVWQSEARDLRADFARAFAHEAEAGRAAGADPLPPLAALGVAADADNTGGRALAWIGDLSLGKGAPPPAAAAAGSAR
ncbi:MAG: DUF3047 domain-containing protein [Burkholderiaceae bacterium]|nr:DUF3047 domain-containing protein [Burkholderiaceae bacterium]